MSQNQNTENPDIQDDNSREMPDVNESRTSNRGPAQKVGLILVALLALLALLAVNGVFSSGDKEEKKRTTQPERVQSRMPPMPPMPEPEKKPEPPKAPVVVTPVAPVAPVAPPPPPRTSTKAGNEKKEPTPEERKMMPQVVAFSANSGKTGNQDAALARGFSPDGPDVANDLSDSLKPAVIKGSRASVMIDRTFMLTQGQFLDCTLETAIDSTVSGMVRARLSKNVYSADGRMVLLERGTRIVGQYQRGMRQGQARLFVLWTRAETPKGVIINIDSPGADELGRSGLDGWVDYHFWERFGAAIMFSLIDDIGQYLVDLAKDNNNDSISLDSTGDAARNTAGIALENSINIPPTLRKNQGDNISIYIARDLDFRGVYAIDFN